MRITGYVTAKKVETDIFEYKKQRNDRFQIQLLEI